MKNTYRVIKQQGTSQHIGLHQYTKDEAIAKVEALRNAGHEKVTYLSEQELFSSKEY